MKKITLIVLGLFLFGCNNPDNAKDKVGKAYVDIWYLTASNPSVDVLMLEVNVIAHSTCKKYMDLKKTMVDQVCKT
jgi:hypothetical protein